MDTGEPPTGDDAHRERAVLATNLVTQAQQLETELKHVKRSLLNLGFRYADGCLCRLDASVDRIQVNPPDDRPSPFAEDYGPVMPAADRYETFRDYLLRRASRPVRDVIERAIRAKHV